VVTILDTTLREGELQPGVYFTKDSRIRVAEALAEIGTSRIEFPIVYPNRGGRVEDIKTAVQRVQENYSKTAVLQFRAYRQDLELAQNYDAKGVALFMAPTSLHRQGKFKGMEQQTVINTLVETLELAKNMGFTYRRATLEDVSRFDSSQSKDSEDTLDFLSELLRAVQDAGATLVSIPDTSGILPQSRCLPFIETVSRLTNQPLACHFHNDYGNALANALQAATHPRVEEIHVSIIGLGTRNGITDHYEFIANFEDLFHKDSGEKRERMRWLYDVFTDATGIPVPWTHPLAPQCFVEKAGTHQSQLVRDPAGYIPRLKLINDAKMEAKFEAGSLMSRHVIEHLLNLADQDHPEAFKPSQTMVSDITETIAARSTLRHREISPWEIQEIVRSIARIEIPIEKIRQVIHGNDRVYILLKLRPQFPSNEIVEEVGDWKEIEQINEVYGDIDVILLGQRVDTNGVEVVDRLRNRFKDAIVNTVTLPVE
jgi:isopropylmalate/homocitrate/citramalate synthase